MEGAGGRREGRAGPRHVFGRLRLPVWDDYRQAKKSDSEGTLTMVLALNLGISSPMPKRAASSPCRSRDEPLLLAGKRASIMLSTTAVDHTWASHHSRGSARSRCSGIERIYERECARMPSTRRPWACARDRRCQNCGVGLGVRAGLVEEDPTAMAFRLYMERAEDVSGCYEAD
jgi:hypothetical protein